ncbi:hypothetical protein NKH82_00020 [Mesorhizobium sp. M0915]|uniref:hypothetical protein n=1 Tax=Mesorhizobium sp. M0915 TaxID=2957027 RepID=UPI00333A6CD6
MSVLDMFASALGAFIMISIILFPYFNNTKLLEETRKNLEQTKALVVMVEGEVESKKKIVQKNDEELEKFPASTAALGKCQARITACKAETTDTFLVIGVEWDERCDVDLYVTDPGGHQYYFIKKKFDGSEAELSLDMRDGPGIEVWQSPKAPPGEYKIAYKAPSCTALESPGGEVLVKGWVIDRSAGRSALPDMRITNVAKDGDLATIAVNSDGSIAIQPQP